MRIYVFFVIAEFTVLLTSHILGFAIGLKVYEESGSVTKFAVIEFAALAPEMFLAGFAGVLVDRLGPKLSLIIGQVGTWMTVLVMGFLYWQGLLEFWSIVILEAISSSFNSFFFPAMSVTLKKMVDDSQIGRGTGLNQLSVSLAQILAPMLAGVLLVYFDLKGIFIFAFSFVFMGLLVTLFTRLPYDDEFPKNSSDEVKTSILNDLLEGWSFVRDKSGLIWLLVFFFIVSFNFGTLLILIPPLVLEFSNKVELGMVLSFGGVGMLIGSSYISLSGGPKNHVTSLLLFVFALGVFIIFVPFTRPSLMLTGIAIFVVMCLWPILSSCNHLIWLRKVPDELIGRVSGLRMMVAGVAIPISYLVSAPLAEYFVGPMIKNSEIASDIFGYKLGSGGVSGVSATIVFSGVVVLASVLVVYLNPRVRLIDNELPDV